MELPSPSHIPPTGDDPLAIAGDIWSMIVSRDSRNVVRIIATFHAPEHGRHFWKWLRHPPPDEQWELWECRMPDLLWRLEELRGQPRQSSVPEEK